MDLLRIKLWSHVLHRIVYLTNVAARLTDCTVPLKRAPKHESSQSCKSCI